MRRLQAFSALICVYRFTCFDAYEQCFWITSSEAEYPQHVIFCRSTLLSIVTF
ncbi:hypothetical protein HMPREF1861_00536 [Corynebacterium kroppenstedtii]|nr:hypothetical protein HMPREF1861_00536 [Corynebacterium kroppenstedtii]